MGIRRVARGAPLWALPAACLVAGLALPAVTLAVDHASPSLIPRAVTGSPAAAQAILTTIASAMITLVTLVLTVMTVAIQLAMSQFSPRIVQTLLRDRASRLSLGLFIGTGGFAIIAAVQTNDQSGFVPGLTVLCAYGLMGASLLVLVLYVHRAGQSLRVAGLIDLVGDALNEEIERRHPDRLPVLAPPDPYVIPSPATGNIVAIDGPGLVNLARASECALELVPTMGEFVAQGAPLLRVSGEMSTGHQHAAARCISLANERTHETDPPYGVRKLVDIAVRSAADDPSTTVQAIDRLHDCLRRLAVRRLPTGRHTDAGGAVRLVVRELTWEGYVRLAFDEVRQTAPKSLQIARRLRAALEDIWTVAPADRRPPLERQLRLLRAHAGEELSDEEDRCAALRPDQLGIGSGPDVAWPQREPTDQLVKGAWDAL